MVQTCQQTVSDISVLNLPFSLCLNYWQQVGPSIRAGHAFRGGEPRGGRRTGLMIGGVSDSAAGRGRDVPQDVDRRAAVGRRPEASNLLELVHMGLKLGHQLDLLVKVAAFFRQFATSLFQLPSKLGVFSSQKSKRIFF